MYDVTGKVERYRSKVCNERVRRLLNYLHSSSNMSGKEKIPIAKFLGFISFQELRVKKSCGFFRLSAKAYEVFFIATLLLENHVTNTAAIQYNAPPALHFHRLRVQLFY